jgi:hypothetical protein
LNLEINASSIICHEGSAADSFAAKEKIPFKLLPEDEEAKINLIFSGHYCSLSELQNIKEAISMKNLFLKAFLVLSFTGFLYQFAFVNQATAAQAPTTIQFNGGKCQISALNLNPPFAPADMKDNEKSFLIQFKYTLNEGATDDAFNVLYEKGQFISQDGKSYKAGAALLKEEDSLYSLIVAVPQDLDVETLKFTYDKTTTEPLKLEIERIVAE